MSKIEFSEEEVLHCWDRARFRSMDKPVEITSQYYLEELNAILDEKIKAQGSIVYCSMPTQHPGMEYAVWTGETCIRRYSPKTHSGILINIKEEPACLK